jgi:hypothetical protein
MTQAEIERRILALERAVPRGQGVSTGGGGGSVYYRDHFPAELTTAFNASVGYSWKRRVLDRSTPEFVTPTAPTAGQFAFTPDNDETLRVGTQGYLLAEPNGAGWTFLPTGSDSAVVDGDCKSACGTIVGDQDDAAYALSVVCHEGEFAGATFAEDYNDIPLSAAQLRHISGTGSGTLHRLQYWDCVGLAWTDWLFNYVGGSGTVELTFQTAAGPDHGDPILKINSTTLLTRCVGGDTTFTGGRKNGFTGGTPPTDPCAPNDFTLRLSCTCKAIDGYQGEGFYCVVAATDPGGCATGTKFCVELLETDKCSTTYVICDCVFPDDPACLASCGGGGGPIPAPACGGHTFTAATCNVSNKTGNCTCMDTTLTRVSQGIDSCVFSIGMNCGTPPGTAFGSITLSCTGGVYKIDASPIVTSVTYVEYTASPFKLVADVVMDAVNPTNFCNGSFRVTITD